MKINKSLDDHIETVFNRARKLIELKYWDNITQRELDAWIDNFKEREERYLAAAILHSLIFRNQNSMLTIGQDIFQIVLPQILEEKGVYDFKSIKEWLVDINSTKCRNLRFRFSAIEDIDDKGVKSSSTILSFLKSKFFDSNLTINSHNIKEHVEKGIEAIIFFDDIIGTGEQFDTFYRVRELSKLNAHIIYIPFAAVLEAVETLQNKYNNLTILPIEKIEPSNSFFCGSNDFLRYTPGLTPELFRDFYLNLCKENRINLHGNLGVGKLELTYVFNASTPNNNLAMLMHKGNGWSGLFKR